MNAIYSTRDGQSLKAFGDYPGLSSKPFHDLEKFPFVLRLESQASTIRDELNSWLAKTRHSELGESEQFWTTRFFNGSYGDNFHGIALVRNGAKVESTSVAFPRTLGILEEHDICGGNRLVFFARQKANSGISPHSDCVNYLLTGHLGLVVPSNGAGECGMQLLMTSHEWKQDKVVVFQNCFMHHTWNNTPTDRILLYFDFFHPDLSADERMAIAALEETRKKHEAKLATSIPDVHRGNLEALMSRVRR